MRSSRLALVATALAVAALAGGARGQGDEGGMPEASNALDAIAGAAQAMAVAATAAATTTAASNYATPYTFVTLAGVASIAGAINGTGTAASFNSPFGVAVDGSGNVYVADTFNSVIRKIGAGGVVTTLAGTAGLAGGLDGTGAAAEFSLPYGVAVDGSGNVYVADSGNSTIRKITPGGVVTTLAGSAGLVGATNGTGTTARFSFPQGVAVDGSGNLYIADTDNSLIRKITAGGVVTTLAGGAGIAGATNGLGTAARFNFPQGVAVDGSGNVFVADTDSDTIREVTAAGEVTTFAGTAGVIGAGDGTGAAAEFSSPQGVAVDSADNLTIADDLNDVIRKISPAGVTTTLAGTAGIIGIVGGKGAAALFDSPAGVAVDASGNVYVADAGDDTIREGFSGSAPVTVTSSGAPVITTEPASVSVEAGKTFSFSVAATGSAPLTYQWRLNGTAIAGATSATYTVTAATSAEAGSYTVTVANGAGSAVSAAAVLTVTNAPPSDAGGAPSLWFDAALVLLAAVRLRGRSGGAAAAGP